MSTVSKSIYIYSWKDDKLQTEVTNMRVYGIDENDETVCMQVKGFTPYIYISLPTHIKWTEGKVGLVAEKIDQILGEKRPLKKTFVEKKGLYYASNHLRPYLCCSFSSRNDIRVLSYKLKKQIYVTNVGYLNLKIHEDNATNELQISCFLDIPITGWIKFVGTPVHAEDKLTYAKQEYIVNWKNISRYECTKVVKPLRMCYDIEVYSSNPNKMPDSKKSKDVVFQISCVFGRGGNTPIETYLLSLFEPDHTTVGEDSDMLLYETEADLLQGFTDLLIEKQPNIICGYNIFTFDIPYMIDRAKLNMIMSDFDKQGFDVYGHSEEKTIDWSSSARKNQHFEYLDTEGRIIIDLLPLIRTANNFSTYTLKFVANYFINDTKDDLQPKQIFKYYDIAKAGKEDASKKIGLVGKYCIQDSMLVYKLFDKLQTWFDLTAMSMVTNVPIFKLYTQGQQLKVFSQVYKKCMSEGVVVERDMYQTSEDDNYQGAFVIDPVPGVYDKVVPFDFSSLYPSIIIAHNIDYTTFVPEGDTSVKDDDCHIFDWDEHIGCIHDTTKHKSKPKHILCGHRHFRFKKEPKGILPMLLEDLLAARKQTKNEMEEYEKILKTDKDNMEIKSLYQVLDKRQNAYKVSANSGYGAMGVKRGYLPLPPGSMCTTAKGRESIGKVMKLLKEKYGGSIVYGDTDSNYVRFPHLEDPKEIWDYAEKVSGEISALFPKPMKLAFEGFIYWRFLILTRKRYMSLKYKNGEVVKKIEKKGVLLARRDNSNFVRSVYEDIVMRIFEYQDKDTIIYQCMNHINNLMSYSFSNKNFVVTKAVGNIGNMEPEMIIGKKDKVKIGDYTVPKLSHIELERLDQLKKKDAENDKDYYSKCLPAQVQLAEKIRNRGGRVDIGTRLEYVIINHPMGAKAKQYEKIESYDYYKDHVGSIYLDFHYYLKALSNPMDQLLESVFGIKDLIFKQYKQELIKQKMLSELKSLFKPKIIF